MRILLLTAATLAIVGSIAGCGGAGSNTATPAATTSVSSRQSDTPPPTRSSDPPRRRNQRPVVFKVMPTAYGRALTDGRGFALYRFTHDRSPASTCYSACAAAWPPYLVSRRSSWAGPGVGAGLLGTVRRADGRLQVTYAGHPLYYYVGDRRPGQILCQGVTEFGGTWYVVAPDGNIIR
jgi:predicted lipoprotein with Yx(FWY)xxD motif